MDVNWMGRYRGLIAELVRHSNITARNMNTRFKMGGQPMSTQEWQIFEYIIEHRNVDDRMIHISEVLQIPQSTFSRTVKYLCECGLVDKYQHTNNRKNIILRPSAYGLEIYNAGAREIHELGFSDFFRDLDALSDEALEIVVSALRRFDDRMFRDDQETPSSDKLIKITQKLPL